MSVVVIGVEEWKCAVASDRLTGRVDYSVGVLGAHLVVRGKKKRKFYYS